MSFFGKLFNSEKKDTTYNGPKPFQSISEIEGGNQYKQNIMDRMAGRNVGFGSDYATKYANPIITNSRANFNDYVVPELTSELSLTGRRRGSGGFDQMRRAYGEQANQENDVFSRLQQRNEDQSRNEINAAYGQVDDYLKNEANMRNTRSDFDYQDNNRQVQEANQRRANQAAGYQNLVYSGADAAIALAGGGGGVGQRQPQQAQGYNSLFSSPNGSFRPSAPPSNYDYSNLVSRTNARNAQAGRIV